MKSEIKIRYADRDDAELLAKLGRETFHDAFADHPAMPTEELSRYLDTAFSPTQLSDELANENSLFMLAEAAGETAGYAMLETNNDSPNVSARNPIKLRRLFSRQKFIGSGVGSSLLDRCLKESTERGHDAMWLIVWEHNLHAQAFYEKWGFKSCGFVDVRFGEVVFSDVVMQRELGVEINK